MPPQLDTSWDKLCKKYCINKPHRIGIALSGGMDSTVLAHWARHTIPDIPIHAYHVHHGLQPEADQWVDHCQQLCDSLNIPLSIHYLDPQTRQPAESIEAWAREARYAWFKTRDHDCMLLGHHQADQAETLLLQLMRGAGVAGLAGMSPAWISENTWWIRPFLHLARSSLLQYAQYHQLTWIEDPSNTDTRYTRNWLRHNVMPVLRQHYPHIDSTLARSASHCAEAWSFVQSTINQDYRACSSHPDILQIEAIKTLSPFQQKQVIRFFIHNWTGKPPSTELLEQALTAFLVPKDPERHRPQIRCRDLCFSLWHNQIWAHRVLASKITTIYPIEYERLFNFPHGTLEILTSESSERYIPYNIIFRAGGESILLPNQPHPRSLKHLWQNANIPPWDRIAFPLITDYKNNIIWAPLTPHYSSDSLSQAHPLLYTGSGLLDVEYPTFQIKWRPTRPQLKKLNPS